MWGISTLPVSANSVVISVHKGTYCQFQKLPFTKETLLTAQGWEVYFFLRNYLPVQSCISFASAIFSAKQTLRAAPPGWKCPPLTCKALVQCSGQVWNYALANKWHSTHWTLNNNVRLKSRCSILLVQKMRLKPHTFNPISTLQNDGNWTWWLPWMILAASGHILLKLVTYKAACGPGLLH